MLYNGEMKNFVRKSQLQGYSKRTYKLVRKKLLKRDLQDEEIVIAFGDTTRVWFCLVYLSYSNIVSVPVMLPPQS